MGKIAHPQDRTKKEIAGRDHILWDVLKWGAEGGPSTLGVAPYSESSLSLLLQISAFV